jgi:hypothetical protein
MYIHKIYVDLIQEKQEIFEEKKDDLSFENKVSVEVVKIENIRRLSADKENITFMVNDDNKKNVDNDDNNNESKIVLNDENLSNEYKDGLKIDIIDPFDSIIDSLIMNNKNENNDNGNNHGKNFEKKKKINVQIMENIIMENVIIPNNIIDENNKKNENENFEILNSDEHDNNYDYFQNGDKMISDTDTEDLTSASSELVVKDKPILNDLNFLKSKNNLTVAQTLLPPSPLGNSVTPISMADHIQVDNMYVLGLMSICIDIYDYSYKLMNIYIYI